MQLLDIVERSLSSCRFLTRSEYLKDNTNLNFGSFQELNTSGGSAAVGSRGPTLRKEAEERDRLAALVKLQGRELDAIKAEINLLRLDTPFSRLRHHSL